MPNNTSPQEILRETDSYHYVPVSVGTRIGSMLLDHLLMCLIIVPLIIFLQSQFPQAQLPSSDTAGTILMALVFAIYPCKDLIGGKSPAKRIIGLQLLNQKTGAVANPYRCLIRNFFVFLWIIEVIVAMINPSRRIGDFIAGTRLELDTTTEKTSTGIVHLLICYLIAVSFCYLLLQSFNFWMLVESSERIEL